MPTSINSTTTRPHFLPVPKASSSWTTIDPAAGFGVKYRAGTLAGRPLTIGTTVTFDWAKSQVVRAQSPNFGSESYTLTTGSQVDTSIMFSATVGLGAATPARTR